MSQLSESQVEARMEMLVVSSFLHLRSICRCLSNGVPGTVLGPGNIMVNKTFSCEQNVFVVLGSMYMGWVCDLSERWCKITSCLGDHPKSMMLIVG